MGSTNGSEEEFNKGGFNLNVVVGSQFCNCEVRI